jgi:hypothetical protein
MAGAPQRATGRASGWCRRHLWFRALVEQTGNARDHPAALLLGRLAQGVTSFLRGEFPAARTYPAQCYELSSPALRAVYGTVTAEDPYAVMLAVLALTLTYQGYFEQGGTRLREALSEARRLEHACPLTLVLNVACRVRLLIGSSEDVPRHVEEVISLSNEHGFAHRLAAGNIHLGWLLTPIRRGT